MRAALEIVDRTREINAAQPEAKRIALHVGINSGLAAVGATRIEGTNVAARLAALGDGSAIVVGAATRHRLGDEFVLDDIGERRLRNVEEPIRVFRLAAAGDSRREACEVVTR